MMRKTIALILVWLVVSGPAFSQGGFKKLAKTPPMGWNSWNTFRKDIHEDLVKEIADAFIEKGLLDAGYEFIVIDDGWQIAFIPGI
jgi:alpha-galactosidase